MLTIKSFLLLNLSSDFGGFSDRRRAHEEEEARNRRKKEREQKRKEKVLEKKRVEDEQRIALNIAKEERKILIAQRKLESIRLLSELIDRVKVRVHFPSLRLLLRYCYVIQAVLY